MPSENCPLYKKHGKHGKVIAIDLDGTLFCEKYPDIGPPIPSVLTRLQWLKERDYEIIIHTSRINGKHYKDHIDSQIKIISETLNKYNLPNYEIWTDCGKPLACYYVDDKSYKTLAKLTNEIEYKEAIQSLNP